MCVRLFCNWLLIHARYVQVDVRFTINSHVLSPRNKTDVLLKMDTDARKVVKTIVTSPDVYPPVGPYSQAILTDKTLYVSGVLGMDKDAKLVSGGVGPQTHQILKNLKHILEAGGGSLESVVKTTVLLADINDFQTFNKIYAEYFPKHSPARATYEVSKLPLGAAIEIEAIALSGELVIAEATACPCARA